MPPRNKFNPLKALKQGNVPLNNRHIKDYAKIFGEELIDLLVDIAKDETNYARDRIQAIDAVLNRAYGRPADGKYSIMPEETQVIDVQKISTPDLERLIRQIELEEAALIEQPLLEAPREEVIKID